MKKFIIPALTVLSAILFVSCSDVKDNDPEPPSVGSSYTPSDVEKLSLGTYSIMSVLGGGDQSGILNNPFYWWSIMSDDCYGSGGLQDYVAKSLHHFTTSSVNQYEQDYILLYGGIMRAISQIEAIGYADWTNNTAQRNQLLGEAYFMRGFYTLLFTQLYGDVPLYTSTQITEEMQQQVSAEEEIYPQILSDFVSAKNLMKAERANGTGRADKYAAEAFLARAWMFWAGFYKGVRELAAEDGSSETTTVTLVAQEGCPEGSKLTKADVVNALKDIVDTGGYALCEDFRSLWQYSNSMLWDEAHDGNNHDYAFIADMSRANCFDQPGMGNGNTEEIFQIQFQNTDWGNYINYTNKLSYYWGLRTGASNNGMRDMTYPFNGGVGQGTPSVNIWDDWSDNDPRKTASLIDFDHELQSYAYEKDDCEESGYGVKKYADVSLDACAADNDSWWSKSPGYCFNGQQRDYFEDFYLMRYADVLLMLTELTGEAQYMNQVQRRAGVPETPYTLTNVQNERRWEFAFEGLRFNDMRRWSGAESHSMSSYAARALQKQAGKLITVQGRRNDRNMAHMTCSWSERYAETKGFLPKPQSQINLMNGKIFQNPGWDLTDKKTQYKVLY